MAAVAAALSAGPLHAEPRAGGVFDRPMFVQVGKDDPGVTLGRFIDCAEQTLSLSASRGYRSPSLGNSADVVTSDNAVTVAFADRGGTIRLNFHITPKAAYLTSLVFPGNRVYRQSEVKHWLVSMLGAACMDRHATRPATTGLVR